MNIYNGGEVNSSKYSKCANNTEDVNNIVSRTYGSTESSTIFLSAYNIDYLQKEIKKNVYYKTNKKYNIGKQSETELKIIMRSMYFQYGKNNDVNISHQVNELNNKVIEWCVGNIITNIKQHEKYKQDINTTPLYQELPQLVTKKGSKVNEMYK
tara:strand:- start:2107 stop:2568 length:462 start_codon:yes stop_codon:yes gene_type:complete